MKINFPLSSFLFPLSRNRVISAASPGVASQYAPDGESESLYWSVLQYRLPCIFRACWNESARGRCVWRDEALVEDDRSCQQPCNRV